MSIFIPDPNDRIQVAIVATALGNARGGRRGMAPVSNVMEMLETTGFRELAEDLREDARAVLSALRLTP